MSAVGAGGCGWALPSTLLLSPAAPPAAPGSWSSSPPPPPLPAHLGHGCPVRPPTASPTWFQSLTARPGRLKGWGMHAAGSARHPPPCGATAGPGLHQLRLVGDETESQVMQYDSLRMTHQASIAIQTSVLPAPRTNRYNWLTGSTHVGSPET